MKQYEILQQRTDLSLQDKKMIDNIKKYGVEVISIFEDERGPAFSFSVGLYDLFGHPEILIIGISQEVAQNIINNLTEDIKKGVRYEPEKLYSGILKNYQCQFKTVYKKYYREYLGFALWYYGGDDFPVIQCIWPDKNQNFPWDKSFNEKEKWYQPILE